jgi:hypothetical protein
MVNEKYKRSDFIAKFIKMNKSEFHSLNLEKVQFEEDIRDLASFLKDTETKIQKLSLISCKIGDSSISKLIEDC